MGFGQTVIDILKALFQTCLTGDDNQNQNQNQNQNEEYEIDEFGNRRYKVEGFSYSQAAGGNNNQTNNKYNKNQAKLNKFNQQHGKTSNDAVPSSTELHDLAKALQKIIKIDKNKFIPGKDIRINPQRSIRVGENGDKASDNLFTYVNMRKLESTPTIDLFFKLLDNYTAELGVSETVNQQEKKEIDRFIDEICKTDPIKYCFNYIVAKGKIREDWAFFKKELFNIWFKGYYRKAVNDTSAFEHVFVGEVKENNDGVIGFHNWITIYKEEQKGNFNYRGWIPPRRDAQYSDKPEQDSFAISIKFDWKGIEKPVTTCLIGTSPECEIAMYTLMYYFSEDIEFKYEDYTIKITMHTFENRNGKTIGSCYPELV